MLYMSIIVCNVKTTLQIVKVDFLMETQKQTCLPLQCSLLKIASQENMVVTLLPSSLYGQIVGIKLF